MTISRNTIATLMAVEVLALAVAATLHLSGADNGGSGNFNPGAAGIAESIILVALAFGAVALVRVPAWGELAALLTTWFAVFGFVVGLTFTIRGGDAPDIAFHAAMLPLLTFTGTALLRASRRRGLSV